MAALIIPYPEWWVNCISIEIENKRLHIGQQLSTRTVCHDFAFQVGNACQVYHGDIRS